MCCWSQENLISIPHSHPLMWAIMYQKNKATVLRAMTKNQVCQLKESSQVYNREWTFRQYALAEGRAHGIQRLHYGREDAVCNLPGPDLKNVKKKLGMTRRISDLYEKDGVTVCPEYICMAGCLEEGRFGANAVSSAAALRRMKRGRCQVCFDQHVSTWKCRVELGHTAN